jgi:hypothetical protein
MSEERMVKLVQEALRERGIDDEVVAAGQFNPRGHSGGLFVGGLTGADAESLARGMGESVGLGAGSLAGLRAADAASGLPGQDACRARDPGRVRLLRADRGGRSMNLARA